VLCSQTEMKVIPECLRRLPPFQIAPLVRPKSRFVSRHPKHRSEAGHLTACLLLSFSFSIILYSSWIAYDKPSYLLDDFSCSLSRLKQAATAFGLWALLCLCRCDASCLPSSIFIPCRSLFTISVEPLDIPRVTLVRTIWQLLASSATVKLHQAKND
jgi:hypothetical protein